MASIKGTQTEKNLLKSFAGESQARNRYTYFAKAARNEGFVQIADIFEETANQEKEHAKQFFKHLEGGMVEITASYPAGSISKTIDNLKASAGGEHEEWSSLYPSFAETAKKEGFEAVAALYTNISIAEKQHEKRYLGLLKNVTDGTVFKKNQKVVWRCRNCGFIHESEEAMKLCPACAHPQGQFELLGENW